MPCPKADLRAKAAVALSQTADKETDTVTENSAAAAVLEALAVQLAQ